MRPDQTQVTLQREGTRITARTSEPLIQQETAGASERDHPYSHLTAPLRQRGLVCTVEYGLSDHIVHAELPDGSALIISPPQEPPTDHPPGYPESWLVTRGHPDDATLHEVLYDSAPDGPHARQGGSIPHLLAAIDTRLDQLGLPPRPESRRPAHESGADAVRTPRPTDPATTGPRATLYDQQLTDRYGSLDAFLAHSTSGDPSMWGAVLDYRRLADCEAGLDRLRTRMHHLSTDPDPDRTVIDHLTETGYDMEELLTDRDRHDRFLRLALTLAPPLPPPDGNDPYADLNPAPNPPQTPRTPAPKPPRPTSLADRTTALAGPLDRLETAFLDPRAQPARRALAADHLAAADSQAVVALVQTDLAELTDGRWYVDWPLMATLWGTITTLTDAIDRRDTDRKRLAETVTRLEHRTRHNPALRAALQQAASPAPPRPTARRTFRSAQEPPGPPPPASGPPPSLGRAPRH